MSESVHLAKMRDERQKYRQCAAAKRAQGKKVYPDASGLLAPCRGHYKEWKRLEGLVAQDRAAAERLAQSVAVATAKGVGYTRAPAPPPPPPTGKGVGARRRPPAQSAGTKGVGSQGSSHSAPGAGADEGHPPVVRIGNQHPAGEELPYTPEPGLLDRIPGGIWTVGAGSIAAITASYFLFFRK